MISSHHLHLHSLANEEPNAVEETPEDAHEVEVDPEDASVWFDPLSSKASTYMIPTLFSIVYNVNHYSTRLCMHCMGYIK